MATFYKPTTPLAGYDPQTVFNAQNQPLSYEQYTSQGGLPNFSNVQSVPQLPQLSPNVNTGVLPNLTPAQSASNPMAIFSKGLFSMLTKAQGLDSAKLLNERNRLAVAQTGQSQAPASELGIE